MEQYAHRIKLKDNINTDNIIADRYRLSCESTQDCAKYVFHDVEEDFYGKVKKGDFLIAGENFGCGSSKEYAPIALKQLGLRAVIAKSFARIFYRNAFNVGLLLLECNTNYIDDGDRLEFLPEQHIIKNLSKGINVSIRQLPLVVRKIIQDNGVIEHIKKNGGFRIEL